jgi:hypothetical protein
MYAAIRQAKAKSGMDDELARRIQRGAISIISSVPGFLGYHVVYAPDDTVTAISVFNTVGRSRRVKPTRIGPDRKEFWTTPVRIRDCHCWSCDRPFLAIAAV